MDLDTAIGRAKKIVDFIKERERITIVSHYDADGISSAAIAALTLDRLGKEYDVITVKKLDPDGIGEISKRGSSFLFVDLGSGQIDNISERIDDFAICDHHETMQGDAEFHLNAHLLGLDGASEVSGAGITYLVSRAVSSGNVDLSRLAIVGAVGDMQDSSGSLVGFNREILKEGVSGGFVESKVDIRFFGRHTRPLVQFLSYSSDPFLPGLSGNDAACARFLSRLGIPLKRDGEWLRYVDLKREERKNLITGLYVYGIDSGLGEDALQSLVGEVYEFPSEEKKSYVRDAKDFATLLNACGRHDRPEIGVKVAMGDRDEYYERAISILYRHRQAIHDGIRWVYDNGIIDLGSIYLIDAGSKVPDSIVGIIAGMMYNTDLVSREKPIIAMAEDEDGMLKVSGRGNWDLVRDGLDLGAAMRDVSEAVGGEGGGHNIAAGATIDPSKKSEFLEMLCKAVSEQLKKN